MLIKTLAESLMREVILSGIGLAISAEKRLMAPKPTKGATETNKSTRPIPPIHWLRLRQSKSEGANSSGESVWAPVVVKPAIELKKASTYPTVPEKTNGKAPTIATTNHPTTTIKKTSRIET